MLARRGLTCLTSGWSFHLYILESGSIRLTLSSDRVLCPHTSDNDNIQCCVGRVRQGLKARSPLDDDIGSILEDTFMGDDNDFSIGTLSRLSGSSLSTSAPPLTMKSTFETNSANDIKTGVTSSLPNYDNTYAAGSNLQKTTAQQASSLSHPLTVGMNDVDWSMNRINSMSAYHPSNNPSAPLGVTANLGGGSTIGASLQNSQPTISYQNNGFKADISAGTYNPLRPLTWSGPTNNISGRIGLNIPKVKRWLGTISSKFNVGK